MRPTIYAEEGARDHARRAPLFFAGTLIWVRPETNATSISHFKRHLRNASPSAHRVCKRRPPEWRNRMLIAIQMGIFSSLFCVARGVRDD